MMPKKTKRRKLSFEPLEARLTMSGDFEITIRANGVAFGATSPQFPVGSELKLDIGVANNSKIAVDAVEVRTIVSGKEPALASPVMVEIVPESKLLATFKIGASRFLAHPNEPYVFATIPASNSLAIFNTQTLKLEANFFVGSKPYGLALSNDGSTVYVANSSSQALSVIDWKSQIVSRRISLSNIPQDIEVGSEGQLYVLTNSNLVQLDPVSGVTTGPNFPVFVYGGELAISPDKRRLYYGDYGLSPASLYQFDITKPTPVLLWESDHGITSGHNGQAVEISPDGSFVSYAAGAGQLGYSIAKYDTEDMSIEGSFDTGPYPREITFSPDGKTAFAIHQAGEIDVFDTTTFLRKPSIETRARFFEDTVTNLMVDRTGQKLFATNGKWIDIYSLAPFTKFVNAGDTNGNEKLDPGETWRFSRTEIAQPALQKVKTLGKLQSGEESPISIESEHSYIGVATPTIVVSFPSENASPATFLSGNRARYEFIVNNKNTVSFANIRVLIDNGTPNEPGDDFFASLVSGDTLSDEILSPFETWIFSATVPVRKGPIDLVATLKANMTDSLGVELAGQIPAQQSVRSAYFGADPDLSLRLENDGNVSSTDVLYVRPGAELQTKLRVTNTGNVPLRDVRVEDSSASDIAIPFQPVTGTPTNRGDLLAIVADLGGRLTFLTDASRGLIYISVFEKNIVAVLDPQSLRIVDRFQVGAGPNQLAISNDNQTLYVASSAAKQVSRINLATRSVIAPFLVGDWVYDVKVGVDRLFVLTDKNLIGLDPDTGRSVGQPVSGYYNGALAISPDKKDLFYAEFAVSPASLKKYTISDNQITLVTTRSDDASNGQDLALSHNGEFIAFAAGYGQYGYQIAQYRTSDMTILGSFSTGPYPREIVYGFDDKTALTVNEAGTIKAWDTTTFIQLYTISTHSLATANELEVSPDGKLLLASFDDALRIYDLSGGKYYNAGDVNRNDQLDVGETWQYISQGVARAGKHEHSTRVSTHYIDLDTLENKSIEWAYCGVVDGALVPENVKGVWVSQVEHEPSSISDNRFVFQQDAIYIRDEAFLQASNNVITVQLTFDDQPSMSIPVHVQRNRYPWHKRSSPFDVNDDSMVTSLDALRIINELNLNGSRSLGARHVRQLVFFDVSGDGNISPLDALQVLNTLNLANRDGGEGETATSKDTRSSLDLFHRESASDPVSSHQSDNDHFQIHAFGILLDWNENAKTCSGNTLVDSFDGHGRRRWWRR